MNQQEVPKHYSYWVTICKRVYLWEYPPIPSSLRNASIIGASDSGQLEYDGSNLRFVGRNKQIEINGIEGISEMKATFGLTGFCGLWLRHSVVALLAATTIYIIDMWGSWVWYVVALPFGLGGAVLHWLFSRKYGRCVYIVYRRPDGDLDQICFSTPPITGGSHKLYKTLLDKKFAAL